MNMPPHTPLEKVLRISRGHKEALARLKIATVRDLLYFFPIRYGNIARVQRIADLAPGAEAIVYGKVERIGKTKSWGKNAPRAEAIISDGSGRLRAVWFHQAYLANMLREGAFVKLSGTISESRGRLSLVNPGFERAAHMPIDAGDSLFARSQEESSAYPVYAESKGITSRWIFRAVQKLLAAGAAQTLPDLVPPPIRKKYHLPSLALALPWIHAPRTEKESKAARKRFAFEEVFLLQLSRLAQKSEYEKNPAFRCSAHEHTTAKFIDAFPFSFTSSQKKCVTTVLADLASHRPMARLLEGDVGSGKTAVAAVAAHAVISSRPPDKPYEILQVAYMAPTEILAAQLFDSFIGYFNGMGISIGLITGSGCRKFPSKVGFVRAQGNGSTEISRPQLLKWVANGEIPILVGTHALIQKSVRFKNLACVIIDEQHRFGTNQRMKLVRKDWTHADTIPRAPHFLSMTATPIPRTLALTIYGDLDVSVIDEMPVGRLPVKTEIVRPRDRDRTYEHMRREIKNGRQAYVICSRIDEPDPEKKAAIAARNVKQEAARLQKDLFPEYVVGALHGKQTPAEKNMTMRRFAAGEIHILVSTSVIEVGVNVPNATVMLIEGASRFGLAQLHQLRGRIMRSSHQPYCFIMFDSENEKTAARLSALTKAKNGFELAEIDLELRGAGELGGGKQWGISDIGMEGIKNIKMVEAAREEASALIARDPALKEYPDLQIRIQTNHETVHFE